jgi:hypothetical protein
MNMERDTQPPTSADAAAMEYSRQLGAQGDGSAAFLASIERLARMAGITTKGPSDDE